VVGAVAFGGSYLLGVSSFWPAFALLVIADGAMYAPYGPFFAWISDRLPRTSPAGRIALINSCGALGSYAVGPARRAHRQPGRVLSVDGGVAADQRPDHRPDYPWRSALKKCGQSPPKKCGGRSRLEPARVNLQRSLTMQPDILMIEPLTPEAERQLDNVYRVHRLFRAGDPVKLVAEIGPSIRAVVTGGAHGVSNAIADALPALEIIAIN
jgi:hypothetical protein